MTLESDIFAHCMPSGQQVAKTEPSPEDKETQPEQNFRFQGRRRPNGPSPHQPQSQKPMDPTLRMVSKLLLKHEAALAGLRQDKNFVLFFRQDERTNSEPQATCQ